PFNSVFTLFGQFFDHGLDLVAKPGPPIVIPLQDDDPLVTHGPDGVEGGTDTVPAGTPMILPRAVADPASQPVNLTTPFVDQNQTYTSHPSHQVFLREYAFDVSNALLPTGKLIEDPGDPAVEGDEGMATWAQVKEQARTTLGIELSDADVLNVPELLTDPYGHFIPGPARGLPQLVTDGDPVEGNLAAPVSPLGAGAHRTGHAFLDDIAHTAVPKTADTDGDPATPPVLNPDPDTVINPPGPPSATYDDEMLNAHFIAGDGRVNENIGLTAIHHVFHSEHNRLADDIDALITAQGQAYADTWKAPNTTSGWGYGERLFQAARFVTEMEYQHLVFEEFARKVQPMINAFGEGGTGYETVTNAAIAGEFAHAVYRFGHSMLTEVVARQTAAGGARDIDLLDAFLNPPAFQEGGLSADVAAGEIFRGMSRQVGNEIDEFVTEALRNNLLGLPLDLPAINIARARDTGVPPLNVVRKRFYEESNNTQVAPYTSWADFGFNLKHRESLVNFVAAYGQHDSITSATTVAAKRAAANELVNPTPVLAPEPAEGATEEEIAAAQQAAADATAAKNAAASEFMFSTGAWETAETGVNLIDLWVGGLAEKQMVGGGLLGATFNYVFEKQLEDLQFGDRFYYLARTQGLNLLVQLEGNSFAELVMRNTDVEGLPADIFSRPDLVFNLPNMGAPGGPIVDDPMTLDNDESVQPDLTWIPGADGPTIRFSGPEHVVFNGRDEAPTAAVPGDRIQSSEGDDTVRGNAGNDWMQGGDGADNLVGGEGDDIMNDLNGDDVLKGGPGNDAMSSGQGFGGDLNQGGLGKDFIIGGNDVTETFAGGGDDFVFAGDDLDTVFGDEGNDWIEGGFGPFNLLQGDSGQAFQDDPNGGHDVIDGNGGEQDYDAEGGDDIMLAGPGIQRSEGMLGFDWVTHKGDPSAANSDMEITGLLPPSLNDLRDRFDLVEALSGWDKDDVLRGDNRTAAELTGADVARPDQNHNLTDEGAARVRGLDALVPADDAASDVRFNAGNIILGGAGSDTIEGRGGNDILDGDKWLNVQLTADVNNDGTRESYESVRDLQNAVFAGDLNPGTIEIDRFIADPVEGTTTPVDIAVFSGAVDEYTVTQGVDGAYTVSHGDGTGVDGVDTLRNIEQVQFGTAAPVAINTLVSNTAGGAVVTLAENLLSVDTAAITDADGPVPLVFSFQWEESHEGGAFGPVEAATESTLTVDADLRGSLVRVVVSYTDGAGRLERVISNVVEVPTVAPGAPTSVNATARAGGATVTWTAPVDDGGSPITGYKIQAVNPTSGAAVGSPVVVTGTGTSGDVTGLLNDGTQYAFTVLATNATGDGAVSEQSNTVTPAGAATPPGAPTIGTAVAGPKQATVNWTAPANNGGSAITQYQVRVVDNRGRQVGGLRNAAGTATSLVVTGLNEGKAYRFQVRARNASGLSAYSAMSGPVTPTRAPRGGDRPRNRNR
ncbi:MAG TPA: peroxidase family protein, partial [Nocardioidaceae bacterium]|nr:peroxidase family protein [Nocardioidaceae bacterium]